MHRIACLMDFIKLTAVLYRRIPESALVIDPIMYCTHGPRAPVELKPHDIVNNHHIGNMDEIPLRSRSHFFWPIQNGAQRVEIKLKMNALIIIIIIIIATH